MSSVNKVILIGNLGADPELNKTAAGMAVTNVSLATSSFSKDEEKTEWHKVTVWDKQAENLAKYMKKGSKIYVEGRLQTTSYEDKEGVTKYKTEIVAERVQFLDSKSKDAAPVAAPAALKTKRNRPAMVQADDDMPF